MIRAIIHDIRQLSAPEELAAATGILIFIGCMYVLARVMA